MLAASAVPVFALAKAVQPASALDPILARWDSDEHPDLRGVVVRSKGAVVSERYYNGETPTSLHDIRSAGKSVTSLLIGAAIDRKLIAGVTDSVQRYWPAAKGSAIGDVLLSQVLTMRSGLAANDEIPDSPGNENNLDLAPDPEVFLLRVPRATSPGTTYVYNSLTAYTAGLVVEKATRRKEVQFAREVLFGPLGIERFTWASDSVGHTKGQGNLAITTRDLAVIGQMVLDGGTFAGRRVISESWLSESTKPWVQIGDVDPYADAYGYFWYSKTHIVDGTPTLVHFASGNGGNKIYVVPSRGLVVAITSSAYGRGYGQRRSEAILKAVLHA
jgi:CubicO group peptidase (beta-lactamase class C family)